MPENTVYVGRPTKWGNPWKPTDRNNPYPAVYAFRNYILSGYEQNTLQEEAKQELKGKNLACWCPLGKPCHADILLEIANE